MLLPWRKWQTPFETLVEYKRGLIEDILKYEAFGVSDGYRKKKLKVEQGRVLQDDSLKVYEILPQNNVLLYKQLCSSLSNNIASDYFRLLDEEEVEEVYTLYAIKVAEGCVEEYKMEEEKKKQKNNGRF